MQTKHIEVAVDSIKLLTHIFTISNTISDLADDVKNNHNDETLKQLNDLKDLHDTYKSFLVAFCLTSAITIVYKQHFPFIDNLIDEEIAYVI